MRTLQFLLVALIAAVTFFGGQIESVHAQKTRYEIFATMPPAIELSREEHEGSEYSPWIFTINFKNEFGETRRVECSIPENPWRSRYDTDQNVLNYFKKTIRKGDAVHMVFTEKEIRDVVNRVNSGQKMKDIVNDYAAVFLEKIKSKNTDGSVISDYARLSSRTGPQAYRNAAVINQGVSSNVDNYTLNYIAHDHKINSLVFVDNQITNKEIKVNMLDRWNGISIPDTLHNISIIDTSESSFEAIEEKVFPLGILHTTSKLGPKKIFLLQKLFLFSTTEEALQRAILYAKENNYNQVSVTFSMTNERDILWYYWSKSKKSFSASSSSSSSSSKKRGGLFGLFPVTKNSSSTSSSANYSDSSSAGGGSYVFTEYECSVTIKWGRSNEPAAATNTETFGDANQ
jgi:hypothetical protein